MGICERIDNVTKIPEKYRGTILPAPISVKIELSAKCNYRCTFCATSKRLRDQGHMDFDLYCDLVDQMVDAGVKELGMFYLGESFLYPKLPEAIKYAKDRGCEYVFLTTNGSIATQDKVRECMKAGLDSLKFSFNYYDDNQFADIAQVNKKYFRQSIVNIQDAWFVRSNGGYKCGLYASYINFDGEQGKRMMNALHEIKYYIDEAYALPLYNQADLVTEDEKAKGWAPSAGNRGRLAALRPGLPCWALFSEGHVTYDGLLTGCCFDHKDDFTFGDMKKMSFMDAWNSERAQWFREHHLNKDVKGTPCESCVAYL